MRRQRPKDAPRPSSVIGDLKKDLPQAQLAAIGALALSFNEAEANLDRLFSIVTNLEDHLQLEVSTRINGIDGIIAVISKGAEKILEKGDWETTDRGYGPRLFQTLQGVS
jgi:hypothetical protein